MKLYFARHGESQANVRRELSTRGLKHPLTPAGRRQALDLAERLRTRSITRVYSSPVLRALETSLLAAHALGVEYEVAEALREYDVGVLEGRADEAAWRQWQAVFDDWTSRQPRGLCLEGGETLRAVTARFTAFVDGLVRQYADSGANLLCVAHGGLYWAALPSVLRNIDVDVIARHNGFDYAALVVAVPGPAGLRCIEWNGVLMGV